MRTPDDREKQAEESGYGATEGEAAEAPDQVLPDAPLQPEGPDDEPHLEPDSTRDEREGR